MAIWGNFDTWSNTIAPPSGWTSTGTQTCDPNSGAAGLCESYDQDPTVPGSQDSFWCFTHVVSGDGPNYTFTAENTGATVACPYGVGQCFPSMFTGGVAVYTGASTTTPVENHTVAFLTPAQTASSGNALVAKGFTTLNNNDMLVTPFVDVNLPNSVGNPAGFTQLWDIAYTSCCTSAASNKTQTTTGTTGNPAASIAAGDYGYAEMIALTTGSVTATPTPSATLTPTPTATPSLACHSIPPDTSLVDNGGNVYTVVGGVIYVNGVLDGYSAGVTILTWDGTDIWQSNGSLWWYQTSAGGAWLPDSGQSTGPTCTTATATATATSTAKATTTPTATIAPTRTATPTHTPTPSIAPTVTPTATATKTPSPSATPTPPPGVAVVAPSPGIAGVQRAGLDLGAETYYGATYYRNNVLENPGFEPVESGRAVEALLPTSTTFCDVVNYYNFPANFYNGATFEDVYSAVASNVGKTGTITAYDPTGAGCANGNPKWTYSAGFTVHPSDIIVVHATGNLPSPAGGCAASPSCGPAAMWWFPNDAKWTTSIDQGSGGDGVQSLQLTLDGSTHAFNFYFDGYGAQNNFLINGNWTFSIWSKAVSATTPSCSAILARTGVKTFFTDTWTPTSSWVQHVVNFTGTDALTPVAVNNLNIQCSGAGTAIRLDDAYLGPTAPSDVWRSQLISALRQIHPGYLRDNQGAQGGSYANVFSDSAARQQTFFNNYYDNHYVYSIPEFFDLNQQVNSRPWIVIPVVLTDAEYTALGAKLAALQATYNFPEVLLEFGNEDWNGGSCGGACFSQGIVVSQTAYAAVANRAFGIIAAAAGAGANLKFVGGAQWGSPPGPADVQIISGLIPNAHYIDAAPYWDWCQDGGASNSTNEMNLWDDPQGDTSEVTMATTVSSLIPVSQKLAFYEMGPSTLGGSATTAERTKIIAGAGSAGAEAQTILRALTAGVPVMNSWQLIQPDMNTTNDYFACTPGDNPAAGTTAPIWGVANFLDTPILRPRGLALELLNNYAIGGDFYPVTGAPNGVTAGAFLQPDGWHLAVTNANPSATSVSIAFPSSSYPLPITQQQVTFVNVTDTNEGATPTVTIGAGPTPTQNSAAQVTVTVPAYGAVAAKP